MSDTHMNTPQDNTPSPDQNSSWSQPHNPDKESVRNRNTIIGVAGGVVALTIAGGALAYNMTMNPTGDRPFQMLPASGIALYAEVNLDPSKDQKEAYMALSDRFEGFGVEGTDLKESLSSTLNDDYSKVEPWIGDRFAAAAYADMDDDGQPEAFTLYQIADGDKAKSYAATLDQPNRIIGEYLIIGAEGTSQESLDSFTSDEDTLANSEMFNEDLDTVKNDSVALAWIDLSSNLWTDTASSALGSSGMQADSSDAPQIQGRIIADMKLNKDGAQAEFRTVDLKMNGEDMSKFYQGDTVGSEFSALSADSQVAFSVGGLDTMLTSMWEQEEFREVLTEVEGSLKDMNINLPDDLPSILGDITSGGLSLNSMMPSGELRMRNGDDEMIKDLLTGAGVDSAGVDVNVADVDGTTVVSLGGAQSSDLISDSKEIMDVVPNLADATSVAYLDLDGLNSALGAMMDVEGGDKSLGRVGMTVAPDDDDDLVTTIVWIVK